MRAAMSVIASFALSLLAVTAFGGPVAAETTTLRMTWYSDGNEGEVMADLLKRFHEQNEDIEIVLDQVPYKAVNETLPVQLASGQGPDMARVVDMGGLSRFALDMRPFLKDPAYWETNFGPFLEWMRPAGDTKAIPGFMTQLTVTGPFVNKTLFEQAGVAMPGEKCTWEDWAKAAKQVADKVQAPFPLALDRSGHRFYALAVSQGRSCSAPMADPMSSTKVLSVRRSWSTTGISPASCRRSCGVRSPARPIAAPTMNSRTPRS